MGRFSSSLARFFAGRRGADQLGMALLITSLVLSLVSSIFGIPILSLLTTALWVYAIFRMLSKNIAQREKENRWFMAKYTPLATGAKQAYARYKNRRIYLYYRCPKCRAWLKLPRNVGEKTVTCGKCGATFQKRA